MTYKRKLIEVALPLTALSDQSAREKNIRQGHPFAIHHWWARRPLVSAWAVLWASLVDDPSSDPDRFPTEADQEQERNRLFGLLEELSTWDNSGDPEVLAAARAEIARSAVGDAPVAVDPFCGFGTISIEAQRLGVDVEGGDLNPVAVLMAKAVIEVLPRFRGLGPVSPDVRAAAAIEAWEGSQGIAEDIRYYGNRIREEALGRIGHLYPKVALPPEEGGGEATAIAWIWARTVESPDPSWSGRVPLVKSWVLKKPKTGPPAVWVVPRTDENTQRVEFELASTGEVPASTIKRAKGTCVATGSTITEKYIKSEGVQGRIGTQLVAVALEGDRGRVYLAASETSAPPEPDAPDDSPALTLATHSQYMGPPLYGYTEIADLFTNRQLWTLVTFSDLVQEIRAEIEADAKVAGFSDDETALRDGGRGAPAYAEAVAMFLAFAVDKLADLGNTFCAWEPIAQCPRHLFGRQAMPMIWDFAEANPFSESSGSWKVIVDGIVRAFSSVGFPAATASGSISQRDAVALLRDSSGVLVCTDPPYYDNVPYADLADFFYVWLRRSLRSSWPDILSTVASPKAEELVADARRHGGKEAADEFFETGMTEFFRAAREVQNDNYPLTVYYAFRQSEKQEEGVLSTGWQSFLQGILESGFSVVATWPIRTESAGRLRAHKSNALASSIVLACRPRPVSASLATRSEFLRALQSELPDSIRVLQKQLIAPVDMAQSAIGPGIAVFSRYSKVLEADGSEMTVRQALALTNEVLQEVLSAEETEFDSDTRWALTWFEQNGMNRGPFGDAETLSKAKNTSVAGVINAGIAQQRDGKVRLLTRDELDIDWDPSSDERLTVWEVTQHLIARLESSELEAANLLSQVGAGIGDRSRQLAHLLYQVANRRGWADEAVAYDGLVRAWPELSKLVGQAESPVQETFGE